MASLNFKRKVETPEERAFRLLLQHLTPEQQATYREKNYFDFEAQGGTVYRLYSWQGIRDLVGKGFTGSTRARLYDITKGKNSVQFQGWNIWSTAESFMPQEDELLSIKLIIETGLDPSGVACRAVLYPYPGMFD